MLDGMPRFAKRPEDILHSGSHHLYQVVIRMISTPNANLPVLSNGNAISMHDRRVAVPA